jgi:hypothetical protein
MSLSAWQETFVAAQVDGAAIANTTTATSLIGGTGTGASHAKITLPANYFQIGRALRITATGRVSTLVTTPGTLTLDVRLGAVIAANGGAMTLSTTAKTNVTWELVWLLTCRAIGSGTTANLMHTGRWTSEAAGATTVAGEAKSIMLPQSAPAVGTGFDSTAAQTVDIFATWQTANAANTIQLHQYTLESLN